MQLDYDKFISELFWQRTGSYIYKGEARNSQYTANLSWDWPDGGAVLTVYRYDILVHAEKGEAIVRMIKEVSEVIQKRDAERQTNYTQAFWERFGKEEES